MPPAGSPTASSDREQLAPRALQICALLTAGFLVTLVVPDVSYFDTPGDYASMHAALEFLAMSVGVMVFALAWNLRRMASPAWVLLVGLTALAIVLVDLLHTLSFTGMPDLVTPSGTEKTINFWLVGRGIAAATLLAVAFMPNRRVTATNWYLGLAVVLTGSAVVGWLGLHYPQMWPDTYVEGQGLTRLKVVAELLLSVTYIAAAVLLLRRSRRESSRELAWLAGAAWVMALAELFFARYSQVTDTANLLGHVYKAIAYLMVYRAIFVVGVQGPYLSLLREKALLGSLIDSMPDLISISDREGRILGANHAFAQNAGAPVSDLLGQRVAGLRPDLTQPTPTQAMGRSEAWTADSAGEQRLYETIDTPFVDPDGAIVGTIAVSRDVTELGVARMEIQQLARFDQLTGLPNRSRLLAVLDSQLAHATKTDRPLALLHIDLGEFRAINETLGHSVGDEVLLAVAARLTEVADSFAAPGGEAPTVARLVGDEFAVICPNSEPGDAVLLARAIVAAVSDPLSVASYQLNVTAAVGIALCPEHSEQTDGLLRCAEAAARQAKADGQNSVAVFTESMMVATIARNSLVAQLRVALEEGQFEVHYQPQFNLSDDSLAGVEALVRWRHPRDGPQAPGRFIEVAEDCGLIVPIGDWVLHTAALQLAEWHRAGLAVPFVAVNLSPVQFLQSGLPTRVAAILAESGLQPGELELEVTEGLAMSNSDPVVERLTRLREIGASIAIDDFGTGYSSMAYLKRFPVDRIRIDRSFVSGLGQDPRDEAITSAILHIARALGYSTMAEGVETVAQRDRLREMGCDAMQGYLQCRPLPLAQATCFLKEALSGASGNLAQLAPQAGAARV